MARKPRNERTAGTYHVYARGNNGEMIFKCDEDRRDYLVRLRLVAAEMGWRVLYRTLLGNHLHAVIETTKPNLGEGMRKLQGGFAQQFNRKYGRTGHLFGDRYGSVAITSDDHFRVAVRYIARNPIEAGLARQLGDWPWDSWNNVIGRDEHSDIDRARLLERFSTGAVDALARFREFVQAPKLPPPER